VLKSKAMDFSYSSPSTDSDSRLSDLVTMLSTQEMNPNSPLDSSRRPMITEVIAVPTSEHVAQIVGKGFRHYFFKYKLFDHIFKFYTLVFMPFSMSGF
jgi:hypothetical protein